MNFKKRNRWYGLLLSFVLLFSLGGCGDVQTENPQPSIETSVTDTTQEASDAEAITDELDQSELQDQDDRFQMQSRSHPQVHPLMPSLPMKAMHL